MNPVEKAKADALYDRARALVLREGYASVSLVQRHLELGYMAGKGIVARLEKEGVVADSDPTGRRSLNPDKHCDLKGHTMLDQSSDVPETTIFDRLKRIPSRKWAIGIGVAVIVILLKSWVLSSSDDEAQYESEATQAPQDQPHIMARNFRAHASRVSDPTSQIACAQTADNIDGVADSGYPDHIKVGMIERMAGNMAHLCLR